MDAALVVCYSNTGNARRVAQVICSQRGWPLGEITEDGPRKGAGGMLRCVLDSLLRRRPAIRYSGPEPGGFRVVLLVAPVWVGQMAGPMRSFIWQHRDSLRHHIAFVATTGGGDPEGAFAELKRLLGRSPVYTAAFKADEIAGGVPPDKVRQVAEALVPGSSLRSEGAADPTAGTAAIASP